MVDGPVWMSKACSIALRNKEQTEALLLESAVKLFREREYDAVSLQEVALNAGLSKRVASYYFADTRMLFLLIVERAYEHLARLDLSGKRDLQSVLAAAIDFLCGCRITTRLLEMDVARHGITERARRSSLYRELSAALAPQEGSAFLREVDDLFIAVLQIPRLHLLCDQKGSPVFARRLQLAVELVAAIRA